MKTNRFVYEIVYYFTGTAHASPCKIIHVIIKSIKNIQTMTDIWINCIHSWMGRVGNSHKFKHSKSSNLRDHILVLRRRKERKKEKEKENNGIQ